MMIQLIRVDTSLVTGLGC